MLNTHRVLIALALCMCIVGTSCKHEPVDPNPDPGTDTTSNNIPTSGLLAYYQFNGDAVDLSGNGFHGTLRNGVEFVQGRTTKAGMAAMFDGVNDYVAIPNSAHSKLEMDSAFTISFWLKGYAPSSSNAWSYLITKAAPFGNGYYLKWDHDNNRRLALYLVRGAAGMSTPYDVLGMDNNEFIGNWHHVAFTWSRFHRTMLMYVDGVVRSTLSDVAWDASHSGTLQLGGYENGTGGSSFPGLMDDVRIYGRALPSSDIVSLSKELK
jgi:hypothetical protein